MEEINKYSHYKKANKVLNEVISKLEKNESSNFEDWFDVDLASSDVYATIFAFRKFWLKSLTDRFPDNPWSWYYYSTFLKYHTNFQKNAYNAAMKAIAILQNKHEFIGAISRHYINMALERQEYSLIDREIERLNNNPNKDSQILYGVAEDIFNKTPKNSLSQPSITVLKLYHEKNTSD